MDKISLFNVIVLKNHREQFAMNGKEARERERERGRDRERFNLLIMILIFNQDNLIRKGITTMTYICEAGTIPFAFAIYTYSSNVFAII